MNVTYIAHFNDTKLSNETKETLRNATIIKDKWEDALNKTTNVTLNFSAPVEDLSVNPCDFSTICANETSRCQWTLKDGMSCSCRPGYVHEPSDKVDNPHCSWAGNA